MILNLHFCWAKKAKFFLIGTDSESSKTDIIPRRQFFGRCLQQRLCAPPVMVLQSRTSTIFLDLHSRLSTCKRAIQYLINEK